MSLARRLWIYQAERFPLAKTALLLAVFSAASVSVSAVMADRPLPGLGAYLAAFVVVFVIFFQLRVCDEVKDHDDDMLYRPERPIPRGLVSLRLIIGLGVAAAPVAVIAVWLWHPPVLWLLGLVWLWLAAMTVEFGVPDWLKARPLVYLVSHMAIMPVIDLLLTGMEWLPGGGAPPDLWMFLVLSFVNGCVLEIGRKIWAEERKGVDTYSRLWGARRAAAIWLGLVLAAFVMLCLVGRAVGAPWLVAGVGAAGLLACAWVALRFRAAPDAVWQKRLDTAAGLWVFVCYGAAGLLPVLARGG